MLEEKEISSFIKEIFANSILEQAHQQKTEKNYRSFHVSIDLFDLIKNHPKVGGIIVGNYPHFVQILEKAIQQVLQQANMRLSLYGSKISVYFENCMIPRHNLMSIEFLTASLNQPNGTLIYLKDAEIVSIKESELYRQSWTQIWEYICDCKFSVNNESGKILKRKVTQSLLDIITKGYTTNMKDYCKGLEPPLCSECELSLRFLTRDEFVYEQCNQIQVMAETRSSIFDNNVEFFNGGTYKILVDKHNTGKFRKGDIFNTCCFLKSSIELSKPSAFIPRVQTDINNLIYMICSYPQRYYLTPSNNIFFGKLRDVNLQQRPITNMNSITNMVYNYKNLTEAINQVRFPYLGPNTLTALKLVTLASIFSQQANHEKLNLLVITDEVSMMVKFLQINDLAIRKFPSVYDEKTISNFFNSCQNSIVLLSNPDKRQVLLINKILRKEAYSNINFVMWIVCEPEENLKKKIDLNEIQIILDLTVEKNLNVCESVYVCMIDEFLDSFMQRDDEEDELVATIVKKFTRQGDLFGFYDDERMENSMRKISHNDTLKEQRLANDLLRRYFLKARQYKTIKLATMQTLTLIAQSFTQFRYFIEHKGFFQPNEKAPSGTQLHISILDVILAIFIDEQTSRNKYSSSNTLFADEVSKIMLNENTCNVNIWEYEVDDGYVQEAKRLVPRDQLVGMVMGKIVGLVYDEDR